MLTSKQIRYLRGLGHHLQPAVMVGREGITDTVIAALNASLNAHELIKVKLQQNCPFSKQEAGKNLSSLAPAELVQVLGKTVLLYRHNPDLKKDNPIKLP